MKRYTLEQRDAQIKFHRTYIQDMIRNYERLAIGAELGYISHAITIYRDTLDHIDEVFGKEEDE